MLSYKIRHYISKVSCWIFIFSLLFSIQRFIVINLIDINKYVLFDKIYAHEIILCITTIIIIKRFFVISSPYEKYIENNN